MVCKPHIKTGATMLTKLIPSAKLNMIDDLTNGEVYKKLNDYDCMPNIVGVAIYSKGDSKKFLITQGKTFLNVHVEKFGVMTPLLTEIGDNYFGKAMSYRNGDSLTLITLTDDDIRLLDIERV